MQPELTRLALAATLVTVSGFARPAHAQVAAPPSLAPEAPPPADTTNPLVRYPRLIHANFGVEGTWGDGGGRWGYRLQAGLSHSYGSGRAQLQLAAGATYGYTTVWDGPRTDGMRSERKFHELGPVLQAGLRIANGDVVDYRLFASVGYVVAVGGSDGTGPMSLPRENAFRLSVGANWFAAIFDAMDADTRSGGDGNNGKGFVSVLLLLMPQQLEVVSLITPSARTTGVLFSYGF